jgi:hypothetical protein
MITAEMELHLLLNDAERAELLRLVDKACSELGVEIHRTDSLSVKEILNRKEAILGAIADKLRALHG